MHIEELTLYAPDLAMLETFYGETLGLPTSYLPGEHLSIQIGTSGLLFLPGAPAQYHFAIRIPAAHFAAARTWLMQRATLITDSFGVDTFDSAGWNTRAVYFYDPVGNIVELIGHNELDDPHDGLFDADALLAICEIGIATDNVPAAVRQFGELLGEGPFRGSVSENFTAVGDSHGLLIIVSRGRIWYPETGIAAAILPFQAVLITHDGRRVTIAGPLT